MQKKSQKSLQFKRIVLSLQLLFRVCENPNEL